MPDDLNAFLNASVVELLTYAKLHANAAIMMNLAAEARRAGDEKAFYEAMMQLASLADKQDAATAAPKDGARA